MTYRGWELITSQIKPTNIHRKLGKRTLKYIQYYLKKGSLWRRLRVGRRGLRKGTATSGVRRLLSSWVCSL